MNKRKQSIEEIAIRNEQPVWRVLEIYARFNYRLYTRKFDKEGKISMYHQDLEDQTFKLTERWFDIYHPLVSMKHGVRGEKGR